MASPWTNRSPYWNTVLNEERLTNRSYNEPFSWQFPQPTASGRRAALNAELASNEQRHFGQGMTFVDEAQGISTAIPPSIHSISNFIPSSTEMADQGCGYMQRPSAFSWDSNQPPTTPTEQSFLDQHPKGNATISYQNDEKELESIRGVNIDIIKERSPVLDMAFESSRSGPKLYLEALTAATALPFLRFLYTSSYTLDGECDDVPTSVLFHCQLFRLGDIADCEALKRQAYVNVVRQCEFGCSSPDKPIDLCKAIRYAYEHLQKHANLINTIINYCVACFLQHRLGEDEDFRNLAYELRPFHQDLCKESMNREFENETASAIIQMPFKPWVPETYASREDISAKIFDDVVYHFHAQDEMDNTPKKRKRPEAPIASSSDLKPLPTGTFDLSFDYLSGKLVTEECEYRLFGKRRASSAASSSGLRPIAGPEASKVALPLRPYPESRQLISDESESEGDLPKVREAVSPPPAADPFSDSEFEVIEDPRSAEVLSDSDSDASTVVEVSHEDANPPGSSDNQGVGAAANAGSADPDSDSDSEWQML